jgi:phosphopantothenoylcysteine decarboxylase/phosphopantothenate--cysteine ligase
MKKKKEILIGVTGGISAYKACELIRLLQKKGYGVSAALTNNAAKFITPLTFRTLTSRKVAIDMFDEGIEWELEHIALADMADVIAVVPATANFIAKLASGICDDIISCTITATKAKVVIAPAMNDNMYKHPTVKGNLKKLKSFGYKIVEPIKGNLACGRVGVGHLAEVQTIAGQIEKLLK